jgi:hypothetical protein
MAMYDGNKDLKKIRSIQTPLTDDEQREVIDVLVNEIIELKDDLQRLRDQVQYKYEDY